MEIIWEPELSKAQAVQNLESASIRTLWNIRRRIRDLPKRQGAGACKVGGGKAGTPFFCKSFLSDLTVLLETHCLCATCI